MKSEKKLQLDIVSKYRSQIYGFAAIWVVLHHAFDFHVFQLESLGTFGQFINKACMWGNMSVDIFLFLSGISLYFAWEKNKDYGRFFKSRLKRIIPAFLLIVGPCAFYVFVLRPEGHVNDFFLIMSTMSLWFNGGRFCPWYVSGILLFYILYPAIHEFIHSGNNKNNKKSFVRYIIAMLFTYYVILGFHAYNESYYQMIELVLCRLPIFITGCYMGKFVKEKKEISAKWWLPIIVMAIIYGVLRVKSDPYWYFRLPFILGAFSFTFILAYIFKAIDNIRSKAGKAINKFFDKTGEISFEFYLTHVMFFKVVTMDSYFVYSKWLWLLGMIGSYLAAFLVKELVDKGIKYIDSRKEEMY